MENEKPLSERAQQPEGAESNSNASELSRRKTIDRREGEDSEQFAEGDRREATDRRSKKAKLPVNAKKQAPINKLQQKVQQHRKKKLLAGCEACMGMNYDTLAMDDYPSNEQVAEAKRDRDYWTAVCAVCTVVFFFGLVGLVPAVIAGVSCGAALLGFTLAFTPVRQRFFSAPSLKELISQRKAIEFRALTHIQFLEGTSGLAWRCEHMRKYNNNLERKLFRGLVQCSRARNMMDIIRTKKQIRLYLLFMIESQKAYKRLQMDYLERHFKNVEDGWDDALEPDELAKVSDEELTQVPQPEGKK